MPKWRSKLRKGQQKKLKMWLAQGFSYEAIRNKARGLGWPELTDKVFQYWQKRVNEEQKQIEDELYKDLWGRSFADKRERMLTYIALCENLWAKPVGELDIKHRKELRDTMGDLRTEIEGIGKAETINVNFFLQQAAEPLVRALEYVFVKYISDGETRRRALVDLQNALREVSEQGGGRLALPTGIHREQILDSGQEQEQNIVEIQPSPGDDTRGD